MSDEKQEISRPINEAAVSKANVDPVEKDMFDDVFGEDREKEQARLLFKKKLEEDNAKKRKAKQAQNESNQSGVKDAENAEKAVNVEKETISEKENLQIVEINEKASAVKSKKDFSKKPKIKLKGGLEDSEMEKTGKEKPVVESSGQEIPLAEKLKKMSEDLEKIQPKKSRFRQNADAVFVGKKDSDGPFPMKPEPPPKPPKPPKPIKPKMAEAEIESSFVDFNSEDRKKIKEVILKKAQKSLSEIPKIGEDEEDEIKEIGIREEPLSEEQKMEREIEEGKENAIAEKIGLKPELSFLDYPEKNSVFIGRKKSVFEKYHDEAALYLGTIDEKGSHESKKVLLDALNPHVVFVCGARGSGKSYVLGIIAEELALKNKNVGIIVIDPIGVFWSMRFPNKEERELALLAKYDLLPQGLNNLKVFIPLGLKDDVPRSTYDATFAIQPSLLTTDDWCLTFGIDRFSPTGLLLEKALVKVRQGFRNKDKVQIKARGEKFSLEDLIMTLETDEELNSSDRGYKADSIRALSSRFDAAKGWGIFSEKGTPLSELSRENQLAIIDTSFLEDNVSALVIGILARRILAARKISTRRAAAEKLKTADVDEALELEIPPTWLFIDEAHTLIPSGNVKTPATNSLVEYVKQGRQPGCSLVFATQQPSAIDTKVLSQLDIIMAHKLIFDDDIKAIFKRTPTIIPAKYKASSFIKTLPVGTAVTGDRREETSRAFIMKIRPRMSQHEGREAETAELSKELAPDKAKSLAVEMINSKLDKEGMLDIHTIENLIQTLSARYKTPIQLNETLDELEKRGKIIDPKAKTVSIKGWKEETELEKQQLKAVQDAKEKQKSTAEMVKDGVLVPLKKFFGKSDEKNLEEKAIVQKMLEEKGIEQLSENQPVELLAFSKHFNEKQATALFDKIRQKKFLGFLGEEEAVDNVSLKHLPVYKIKYHVYDSPETFFVGEGYVDAVKGEFIHYKKDKGIIESKGLILAKDIERNEKPILHLLAERQRMDFGEICRIMKGKPEDVKQILENLIIKDFVKEEKTGKETEYLLKKQLDLPKESLHALMTSMKRVSVKEETSISIKNAQIDKNQLNELLKRLWENVKLKEIEILYLPIYEAELKKKNGEKRTITIEAVSGNQL